MKIKIAFFDVDGTLLKMGVKAPSIKTVYALKELQKNGVKICMATGRGYSIVPHFNDLDFDVLLTFNGSYVRNRYEVIYKRPLDHDDVNKILSNLNEMNRVAAISNEYLVVANGTDEDLIQYFRFGCEEVKVSDNFNELCKGDIYQIMCSCNREEYDRILSGTSNARITAWWDRAVDIIPSDGGKGNAVRKVLEYYGFEKDEAIAFGDGRNDIEMLEAVGTGVAMGNAEDCVKQQADIVCDSVENDGIFFYCLGEKLITNRI